MGKELFTKELKSAVVQYVLEGHTRREASEKFCVSCTPTAMHFCLDVVTVCRWDKKFREKGTQGLMTEKNPGIPVKRQKAQEPAVLKQENRRLELRMENDYLK